MVRCLSMMIILNNFVGGVSRMEFTIDCAETYHDVYHYDSILKKYWINREERKIMINSVNQLVRLQNELGEDLIFGKNNSILIYDDYIE
ncbi:hypothetical protein KNV66_gp27 [Bacillus phage DLc1]|uniref:Uncharacterized protein n=1 Tax=Bacillus phage DLc1 TaxID=2777318 RepID=A0A7M1RPV2_9CAUD|nr:hypothetical protein KNV66_gp27 [Bacillus phage DLc1]QOR56276.1 hypothetical protein [Bacillus phage DLc1]